MKLIRLLRATLDGSKNSAWIEDVCYILWITARRRTFKLAVQHCTQRCNKGIKQAEGKHYYHMVAFARLFCERTISILLQSIRGNGGKGTYFHYPEKGDSEDSLDYQFYRNGVHGTGSYRVIPIMVSC